jgi:hypothetical protein
VCDEILEVFDGSQMVAFRLTLMPTIRSLKQVITSHRNGARISFTLRRRSVGVQVLQNLQHENLN